MTDCVAADSLLGSGTSRVVVLSPHLDDAVLSCGALMRAMTQAKLLVTVVTVFDGPPDRPLSPLAHDFHKSCRLDDNAMEVRQAEDRTACALLGIATQGIGLRECLYRRRQDGAPIYSQTSEIFVGHLGHEPTLPYEVADAITRRGVLNHADLVLAPLGVGGHVDHTAVRLALNVLRFDRHILHYEDIPYVLYERCRGWERTLSTLSPHVVRFSLDDWERKLAAVAEYRSQHHVLWVDPAPWQEQLCAYAAELTEAGGVGERFWKL